MFFPLKAALKHVHHEACTSLIAELNSSMQVAHKFKLYALWFENRFDNPIEQSN